MRVLCTLTCLRSINMRATPRSNLDLAHHELVELLLVHAVAGIALLNDGRAGLELAGIEIAGNPARTACGLYHRGWHLDQDQ